MNLTLRKILHCSRTNPAAKVAKARKACLNEWIENYNYVSTYTGNDEARLYKESILTACRHNRVLPKLALVGITILLVITLVAII